MSSLISFPSRQCLAFVLNKGPTYIHTYIGMDIIDGGKKRPVSLDQCNSFCVDSICVHSHLKTMSFTH